MENEVIVFYLELFGLLSIPCILSILLLKFKVLKTKRSTYYFSIFETSVFFSVKTLFFNSELAGPHCGFSPGLTLFIAIIIVIPILILIQNVLNRLLIVG